MQQTVTKMGKRGTFVIPSEFRVKLNLKDGDLLIAEERPEGLLLRPAIAVSIENYSDKRKAEFLLSNAINKKDYQEARKKVKKMGLNPDDIPHYKPE
jgi:AbrB family looped-hinge helix DNA binding protein